MKVPFIDFSGQYNEIKAEVDEGLKNVLETGNFILGQPVKDFEKEFAEYCQTKYGIGVNSGTDAIHLALRAAGIGPGDEVILPTFTFVASALPISYIGAKPVLVDIEESTYNIDPKAIEKAISPKTKAIICVHLYGQAASMEEILDIAKKKNIKVIEDACQAHGAVYKNQRVGCLGDVACFSFYPTKSLGACGDGGMIVTNDDKIAENAISLRDYGRKGRYEHMIKGYNSRLDTMQAVILSEKLKNLDKWNKMRDNVASQYFEALKEVEEIGLPMTSSDRTHVFQTYAIAVKKDRDKVLERMQNREVGILIHYPISVHMQPAYKDLGYKQGDFPVAESFQDQEMSLPMFPHMEKEQVDYVVSCLKESLTGE